MDGNLPIKEVKLSLAIALATKKKKNKIKVLVKNYSKSGIL